MTLPLLRSLTLLSIVATLSSRFLSRLSHSSHSFLLVAVIDLKLSEANSSSLKRLISSFSLSFSVDSSFTC